jgi:hypothetical protein
MTITICTPMGNIGCHVVRELLDAGELFASLPATQTSWM